MSIFLYVSETVDSVRSKLVGYAQLGGLVMSNWLLGGAGRQLLEAVAKTVEASTRQNAQAIRGFASLDTSVDPGDVDPYDAGNVLLAPSAGYLSDLGSNVYGTTREEASFATGFVTFTNSGAGAVSQTFLPFALTLQRDFANADGSVPQYRNADGGPTYSRPGGGTIAANPDGSLTVGVGIDVLLPIQAEEVGSASNASATHVSVLVNVLPGVTVSNAAAVLGSDRQGADAYRDACREEAALTSPNGAGDAYRYLAVTARSDGTYGKSTTGTPVGITRVYVSAGAVFGVVNVYLANAAGAPSGADVTIVDTLITLTPGVIAVPDAIQINVLAAVNVVIDITYSMKVKASSVVGGVAGVYTQGAQGVAAPVFAANEAAINAHLEGVDIGGDNQIAGAGTIATEDFRGVLFGAWPTANTVAVTLPAGLTTGIAVGHVGVSGVFTGTVTLT
jgi:hypothetical protein